MEDKGVGQCSGEWVVERALRTCSIWECWISFADPWAKRRHLRRGLFQPEAVTELVEADRAGRVDASYTLFSLMCVELWCRMFIDEMRPTLRAI